MELIGKKVKIKVAVAPESTSYSLLGTVMLTRNNKLMVKLAKPLTGRYMASNVIELRPVYNNQGFDSMGSEQGVPVACYLVNPNNTRFDRIMTGRVCIDNRNRLRVLYAAPKQMDQNLKLNPTCMIGLG